MPPFTGTSGWRRCNEIPRLSAARSSGKARNRYRWFEASLGRAAIFGAFLDGTLAGMAGFAPQESAKRAHKALLWGMYVRAAARNAGVGKRLVAAVLDHARGRVEMVQLTVVSENEAARRLYRAMGFVEYGYEKRALRQDGK